VQLPLKILKHVESAHRAIEHFGHLRVNLPTQMWFVEPEMAVKAGNIA